MNNQANIFEQSQKFQNKDGCTTLLFIPQNYVCSRGWLTLLPGIEESLVAYPI